VGRIGPKSLIKVREINKKAGVYNVFQNLRKGADCEKKYIEGNTWEWGVTGRKQRAYVLEGGWLDEIVYI